MANTREGINRSAADFRAALRKRALSAQAVCQHNFIAHLDDLQPRRICLDCGIEEVGSTWSYKLPQIDESGKLSDLWSLYDYSNPVLLGARKGRTFVAVSCAEAFFKLRLCI